MSGLQWSGGCERLIQTSTMFPEPLAVLLALLHLHGTGVHGEGWSIKVPSEVRAVEGYPVVLPCTFSHPHHTRHSALLALWRLGPSAGGHVVFQCSSHNASDGCRPGHSQDPRYRLEGDPRQHDLSLRIHSATLQDAGRYYCRFELPGHLGASFENKMGTLLRVEAPPRILQLWLEGGVESGFRALCQAQGSPLPVVQWTGPDQHLDYLPSYASPSGTHQVTRELRNLTHGGPFTCLATNPLGTERGTLYLLPSDAPLTTPRAPAVPPTPAPVLLLLLCLSLGIKLLLLLAGGGWLLGRGGAFRTLQP
ncbi:sialic acid-binding Ig-like lectin 15 [Amia ocellicauda]|uniref:sialic acid-binding Ig-like lectin 15 n=1 Tax=Amia ocellicauda TaxID=2972642 RepID=UPI003463FA76